MSVQYEAPGPDGSERERTATRLLRSSSKNSYDPLLDIDWDAPVDGPGLAELAFLPFERVSLYGTELWDELTPEQRVELSNRNWPASRAPGCGSRSS